MNTDDAAVMVRAYAARAARLRRMTRRILSAVDESAMANAGRIRLFGDMSKDELIADILACEFPEYGQACAVHYGLCFESACPVSIEAKQPHAPGLEIGAIKCASEPRG